MYFQIIFAMDRVKALAPKHPDWKTKQPFKAVLDNDTKVLAALGEKGFLKIIAATRAGLTAEEFNKIVADRIAIARHPRFQPSVWSLALDCYLLDQGPIDRLAAFS